MGKGGIFRFRSLVVVALAFGAAAGFAPAASAATGSISGTVTDQATADPIGGVEVCAYPETSGAICAMTTADGTYTVPNLDPGNYIVEFWAPQLNYLTQFYPDKASQEEAEAVIVAAGPVTGTDAQMKVAGRIAGTVTEALHPGAGIGDIEVCAEEVNGESLAYRCANTDVNGDYAIVGLPAGDYTVEFWPGEFNLVPEYWQDAVKPQDASSVTVVAGATVEDVDAVLEVGAVISGAVTSASGAALAEVLVCAHDAASGEYVRCTVTGEDGRYWIVGLYNGGFKVGFSEEPTPEFADGYVAQYFDGKATLAEATVVSVAAPLTRAGVGARLRHSGELAPPPQVGPIPTITLPVSPVRPRLDCRRGFRKKRVRGKTRCVKVKKHHRRRHHHRGGGWRYASVAAR